MLDLTPTQWRVLGLLRAFHAEEDRMPTRAELADLGGWKSHNAAEDHIQALVRKGALEDRRGTGRFRFPRDGHSVQDLADQALELEIRVAGLRLELARRLEAGEGCYFVANGGATHYAQRQAELIALRSPEQVRRMELERGL